MIIDNYNVNNDNNNNNNNIPNATFDAQSLINKFNILIINNNDIHITINNRSVVISIFI
jgi:hypothetical protein